MTLLLLLVAAPAPAGNADHGEPIGLWLSIPFVLLLLSIALMPFVSAHWWERRYPAVAIALGAIPVAWYLFVAGAPERVLHTAFEYVSFIALIGSLFVVAGGIHIRIKGKSKPLSNVFLLAVGAAVANIVGTTGASMILIRPFLRVNHYRIRPYHVVFFIFIVSNMGGALTPIGDPPLFLGYLRGIPFFWVAEALWLKWVVAMIAVLVAFYLIDLRSFRSLPAKVRHSAEGEEEEGEVSGSENILFLAVIIGAVFITNPPFLREAIMIGAAVASYLRTKQSVHEKNGFNFLPIREVAILFLGIFATMMPALQWLEQNAAMLGIRTPGAFYWATGVLSSFLDNAPTYLNFLSAAIGLQVTPEAIRAMQQALAGWEGNLTRLGTGMPAEINLALAKVVRYHYDAAVAGTVSIDALKSSYLLGNGGLYVQAISLAAVFFGAMTYIGNGPNFMVKSIATQSGVDCPSFLGYMVRYSIPILLPIFFFIWLVFFT